MRRHLRKNNQLRKIIARNLGLPEHATWEEIGNYQNEQILKQGIETSTSKEIFDKKV